MPPLSKSRHIFSLGKLDSAKRLFLTERVPYTFRAFSDNAEYVVNDGDTLYSIAAKYFVGFEKPSLLWWVIADFQPQPILDPTLRLVSGSVLFIPSIRTITEEIFSNRRYSETEE